jgi:hypothetical protein
MNITEVKKAFGTLQYLNANNLSVIASPTAKTIEGIDKNARLYIRKLLKQELIEPVLDKYDHYRHTPRQFYRPTKILYRKLDIDPKYTREKGQLKEEHDSMKQDVLISMFAAYWNRGFSIKHEPRLGGYTPDAFVEIDDKIIYLELERRMSTGELYTKKLKPIMDFKTPKNAKHLIVLARNFPPYKRHIEYNTPEYQTIKGEIKKMIFKIVAQCELSDKILFMPYPNYYRLIKNPKDAVCYDHKGNLRPLIY